MKNDYAPFMSIADASRATGISQYAIRRGCKDGSIPHIKCGVKYLINFPAFLRKLDELSQEAVR